MTWFLIAIIGPFLYAITNHIDKILLEKYFKEGGVGTLILFSSLLSILALPFIFWGDPTVFSMETSNILVLSVVGLLNILVLWFYLKALETEEASIVIIFYQLVPVMATILGYFILGEVLSNTQLLAMVIIILGTSLVAIEFDDENNLKLRKKTILYMSLASFFWATESVIFKVIALDENVWRTLFWEHIMMVLVGILIYLFISNYRKHFHEALKANSKAILSTNVLNESIYILGNNVVAFAYIMAPIGLVLLTESFQPVFVVIMALLLTIFFPKLSVEEMGAKYLGQKIIAIFITGVGTYLLLMH